MVGRILGNALERSHDQKALALGDYMHKNFSAFRRGEIPLQAFLEGGLFVWNEAPLKGEKYNG